jgi:hypothetical protein
MSRLPGHPKACDYDFRRLKWQILKVSREGKLVPDDKARIQLVWTLKA